MCSNRINNKEENVYEHNYRERIAFYLKELRAQAKVSRARVSRRIGKTEITIRKWEEGETEPTTSLLAELLDYYGYLLGRKISIDEVLGR